VTGPRLTVLAMIRDLTQYTTHHERLRQPHHNRDGSITWLTSDHVTTNPPLITQLHTAVEASGGSEEGPRPAFTSKPAARIDAIDAYTRIDLEAAKWVRQLGEDDPTDTASCITRIAGLAASAHYCDEKPKPGCCTVHAIEADVRSWWNTARILTGWDIPAWSPANTCPLCGVRGLLRIRLAQHVGMCVGCHETWGPESIGLLADHIRAENADDTPTVGSVA